MMQMPPPTRERRRWEYGKHVSVKPRLLLLLLLHVFTTSTADTVISTSIPLEAMPDLQPVDACESTGCKEGVLLVEGAAAASNFTVSARNESESMIYPSETDVEFDVHEGAPGQTEVEEEEEAFGSRQYRHGMMLAGRG